MILTLVLLILVSARRQVCDVSLVGVEVRANEPVDIGDRQPSRIAMVVADPSLTGSWLAKREPDANRDRLLGARIVLLQGGAGEFGPVLPVMVLQMLRGLPLRHLAAPQMIAATAASEGTGRPQRRDLLVGVGAQLREYRVRV